MGDGVARAAGYPARWVILALVAVIVGPGIVFAGVLLQRYAVSEIERYEQEAREVAGAAASVLDRHLTGWRTTLQTLATSRSLQAGDIETFYRQAVTVKRFIGADIGLRSPDGQQLLNTRVPYGSALPRTPLDRDAEALSERQAVITNVFTGAIAQSPLVALIVPVVIEGEARYLLHISASTDLLREVVQPVVPDGWVVAIGDRKGAYVTRSADHASFTGRQGAPAFLALATGRSGNFTSQSAQGEDILVGYVRSNLADWLVAASIRESVVRKPLQKGVLTLAVAGLLALLVSSLIALWLWRLFARPLAVLTQSGRQLGRMDGPIALKTRLREFIALRDALSGASMQIREDSATLERRVAERTAELEASNARLASEIEQRTRAEGMLAQAQKMEAIGNLTGGVAHDFNNLLQVVGGNLQLLSREVAGNDKAMLRIEKAMAGVARGSHLASQLLAFGRRQPLEPRVVNVGRLIRGMDDLLRRTLGEAIEIESSVAGGLWNTLVDPTNLENALLNLAINARDAMDGAGRLTIEAGNAFLDDAYAAGHAEVTAGQYVMIAVTDTGIGMTGEVVEQIFEPFFSTKPEGKGTGLGLSMVYGFLKQSGGHVKVYSEPGQGTTLRLYLPRSMQAEDMPVEVDAGPVVGGGETVLVVEDDAAVRETVVELLGGLGYSVLRASDAQSALVIVESGMAIDLLFTDVVMPGPLRSPELARKAKERLPQLSVLFTSGYTENAIVHGGRLDSGVNLLSKPYSRDQLARKIRQVLARDGKLPVAPGQAEQASAVEPARTGPLRVLVCEDDALIRMDIVDMMAELGHETREAGSAGQALELAAIAGVDLLLTDIGLPDMPGTELARRMRESRPDLPVIFATGHGRVDGFAEDRLTAILAKPFDFEQLTQMLEAMRRRARI